MDRALHPLSSLTSLIVLFSLQEHHHQMKLPSSLSQM